MTRARRPNISSQDSQRVAFRLEVVDSTSGALCFLGNLPSEGCSPFPLQGRQLGLGLCVLPCARSSAHCTQLRAQAGIFISNTACTCETGQFERRFSWILREYQRDAAGESSQ